MHNIKIFGVRIDCLNLGEAINFLSNDKIIIFTPNPEILLMAHKNPSFAKVLNRGDLMLADGHGLLLVSSLLKLKSRFLRLCLFVPYLFVFLFIKSPFKSLIPEVIHGSDFMLILISWAELTGKSVFFLGSTDTVAKKTAEYFASKHPNLKIAGYSNSDPGDMAVKEVQKSGAEVLFVAYGAPKQEKFIFDNFEKLPLVSIAMAVGGSLDFFSGKIKRAPKLLRIMGIEWLWRLLIEPTKRANRILNALLVFPLKAIFSSK